VTYIGMRCRSSGRAAAVRWTARTVITMAAAGARSQGASTSAPPRAASCSMTPQLGTGTGINTYQFANIVYQRHDTASFHSAAHNDYAQLAAEGGLLVVIPAAICLTQLVRVVRRRLREDRPSPAAYSLRVGAVASLAAIGLQETVDFSLQIPGNALLFAVVCGIALHAEARTPGARRNGP